MSSIHPLTVVFVGVPQIVDPSTEGGLTFGRGAELDVDSNPFLHRRVGRFVPAGDVWTVENLSSWSSISVTAGGAVTELSGNGVVALVQPSTLVRFSAGSCNYEIQALLPDGPTLPPPRPHRSELTATHRLGELPLTDEQRLLVVVLAERRLTGAGDGPLPTNGEAAARLGWSDAKFNRKLDHLCVRLDREGVSGLRATGRRANDRRRRLVEHMVGNGFVTADDLHALAVHEQG